MFIGEHKTSEITDIPVRTLRTKRIRGGGPPITSSAARSDTTSTR
jgi:hypothetical protein